MSFFENLFHYIASRQTNRRVSKKSSISVNLLKQLEDACKEINGSNIQLITDQNKLDKLAEIISKYDQLSIKNKFLYSEIIKEIRWDKIQSDKTHDGISLDSLEISKIDGFLFKQLVPYGYSHSLIRYLIGLTVAKSTKKNIQTASAMGLIYMDANNRIDYFNGGRVLERAWLISTKLNLAFWPMTAFVYMCARLNNQYDIELDKKFRNEVLALRKKYLDIFNVDNDAGEIMLFRLSQSAPSLNKSIRHPINEVFHLIK